MSHGSEQFRDLPSGVRVCWRLDGPADGRPLVLVAGLGQQLHAWPEALMSRLTEQGLRVLRLDNRDAGRSSRVQSPPPAAWRQLAARPRAHAYTLTEMAGDVVGLLDVLGIERTHIVGMSMGAMISQTVAATRPERVLSLTSLISTTGQSTVGRTAWSTKRLLLRPPANDQSGWVKRHLEITAHLAGSGFPIDIDSETAYAETAWARGGRDARAASAATARQIQAIQASGDRTSQLRQITAPTLVVHGDRDLIVHPSGGLATAAAIPGARLVSIAGMGHHLAPQLLPRLADLISHHAQGVTA